MVYSQQFDCLDLQGGPDLKQTRSWIGKDVSTVLKTDNISKLILLRSITSATVDIDIRNIVKSINKATKFELVNQYPGNFFSLQAVLLMNNGEYIYYQSTGDLRHITTETGGGFFSRKTH